jgi:tetraacyldisaccharide 4'-kinase
MQLFTWLHQRLPEVWTKRGAVAMALRPLASIYGALMAVRRLSYRWKISPTHRLPALVVVVGNVVAGGAGKTPMTMALVKHLMAQGLRVGVVSRGHGRKTRDVRAVHADSHPNDVGDEPLLILRSTGVPVWVGALRAQAGEQLLKAHPQVQIIVCDDGLQHLALARDIEICVMDDRGQGNGWLLPAGPLREAWPRPVDLLVHTGRSAVAGGFQAPRQLAEHALTQKGLQIPLLSLQNQILDAVAGLARPQAFFEMLRRAGLQLGTTLALPDHHDYKDWQAMGTGRVLVCTEKDAAKLWVHEPEALAVPLELRPEPAFWTALDGLVQKHLSARRQ